MAMMLFIIDAAGKGRKGAAGVRSVLKRTSSIQQSDALHESTAALGRRLAHRAEEGRSSDEGAALDWGATPLAQTSLLAVRPQPPFEVARLRVIPTFT